MRGQTKLKGGKAGLHHYMLWQTAIYLLRDAFYGRMFTTRNPQQEVMTMTQLLTLKAVAQALNVSTPTVKRLIDAGTLKGVRIGRQYRVHPGSLDALLG